MCSRLWVRVSMLHGLAVGWGLGGVLGVARRSYPVPLGIHGSPSYWHTRLCLYCCCRLEKRTSYVKELMSNVALWMHFNYFIHSRNIITFQNNKSVETNNSWCKLSDFVVMVHLLFPWHLNSLVNLHIGEKLKSCTQTTQTWVCRWT